MKRKANKLKSIVDLTQQRNRLQEWLINSGAWKKHPLLYRYIESTWQRYVNNIESFTGKSLAEEGLHSIFANTLFPPKIYK